MWDAVHQVGRQLRRRLGPVLRESGLHSPLDLVVCRMLCRCGPVRVTDLAALVDLPASTASETVDRLVGGGMAAREPHPADRRSIVVRGTAAGEAAVAMVRDTLAEGLAELLGGLSLAELDSVVASLRIVGRAVGGRVPEDRRDGEGTACSHDRDG